MDRGIEKECQWQPWSRSHIRAPPWHAAPDTAIVALEGHGPTVIKTLSDEAPRFSKKR